MIYKPLGQFVRLSQGLAINKSTNHLVSANKNEEFCYPLLRIADMMENRFTKFISKEVNPTVVASQNDIIYTRTGQIGLVFRGYKGVVHNNSFIIKLINDEIDENYLYTLLQSNFVRTQALKLAKNSVQPDLTHEMFKSIMIPIPENKIEQIEISKSYNTIVKKIKTNNEIISELESITKTIYDYWFLQFEFPNEDGKPYKSSGGKMVWNEKLKREIPEGWGIETLGDIIGKVSNSVKSDKTNGLPYTPMDELPMRKMSFGSYKSDKEAKSSLLLYKKNQLLFGSMRAYFHRVCIAPFDGITRTTTFVFEPKVNGSLGYSFETLNLDSTVNYAVANSIGTQQPYAVWESSMSSMKLPKVPLELKLEYSSNIESIIQKVIANNLENQELASLRDFLLPMLMNGQVTFKD